MKDNIIPNFEKRGGLIPVVAQDARNREVLMLAYVNKEAYQLTLKTGIATYYSTSRESIWVKGETSGNTQKIIKILIDCDADALIYVVEQEGVGACHTGARSCFFLNYNVMDQSDAFCCCNNNESRASFVLVRLML